MSLATRTASAPPRPRVLPGARRLGLPVAVLVAALLVAGLASLMVGPTRIDSPATVLQVLAGHGNPLLDAAIRDLRLPRTIVALLIGAGLAVAGALIQAVTRNPIVEPSIIGINSGAALTVSFVTLFYGLSSLRFLGIDLMPFIAFAGAVAAVAMVFAVVGPGGGASPGRIALAGVTVALLANALVMSVVILNEAATRFLIKYLAGGVASSTWASVQTLLPYSVLGLGYAVLLARRVTILSLGDDVASGLGLSVRRVRYQAIGLVVVLAGSAVAVAGPIAMVGLLVPHVVRWLVGTDYLRVLPVSMLVGAVLLVTADVICRLIVRGTEIPVGIMTAMLGTPYFIYLARKGLGAT